MTILEATARAMFKAYNEQGPNPNKTWDGKDVPPWEQLGDQVQGKWLAAASVLIPRMPAIEAEVRVQKAIELACAPLLERLDAAERRAEQATARAEALDDERRAAAMDLQAKRFRVSIVSDVISGQISHDAFDWNAMNKEVADAFELANVVLSKGGL